MVARLAGLPVANASLYDGANALVEAVNLGVAASGRQTVWVSAGIQPHWRAVLATFAAGTGHVLVDVPLADGVTAGPVTRAGPAARRRACWWSATRTTWAASRTSTRPAGSATRPGPCWSWRPTRWRPAVLRSPGECGADVVVGEGQPLGTALSFGGPYLGLFAVAQQHVRRLPGRLVGETVDMEGTRAYVTTLRAREQDIRREKATSNVCTNQTLMAVYCRRPTRMAGHHRACARWRCGAPVATRFCRESLLALAGVEPLTGDHPHIARVRRPHCRSRVASPSSGWPTRGISAAWPWPTWSATTVTARSTRTTPSTAC